jgi:hypothetical protein
MEPLVFGRLGHHLTVELATRYFTSRQDDPTGEPLDFDQTTDPMGVLTSMVNGKYFHGDDNKVKYFTMDRHDIDSPAK